MKREQKIALNSFNQRNGFDQKRYKDDLRTIFESNMQNMPFLLLEHFLGHGYAFVCNSHMVAFNEYDGKTVIPGKDLSRVLNAMNDEMEFEPLNENLDIYGWWGMLQKEHPKCFLKMKDLIFNPYVLFDTYRCVDGGGEIKVLFQHRGWKRIHGSVLFKSDFGSGLALPLIYDVKLSDTVKIINIL